MKRKKQKWAIKQNTIIITIILLLLVSVAVVKYNEEKPERDTVAHTQQTPIPETISVSEPKQTVPLPTPIAYPKPATIPTLRPMDCYDKSHDIWHPCNQSSYITPDNEWVKYYASQLFVDYDGRIKYKNEKVIYYSSNGIDYFTYKSFINNYVYDWEQFSTSQGSLANDDYWANSDYYLTNGMKGDCDEWMIVVTSMMLSGEMSVWEGDKLIKQIIPAKAVFGYMQNTKDGWVEYQVYNKKFITSTAREIEAITENKISQTWYLDESNELFRVYKPIFEFTNMYFRRI